MNHARITHFLKTHPEPFADLASGRKTFEIRKDDRGFMVGDLLVLQEWQPLGAYTGREIRALVTHKLAGSRFGVPEGYCILSIQTALQPQVQLGLASGSDRPVAMRVSFFEGSEAYLFDPTAPQGALYWCLTWKPADAMPTWMAEPRALRVEPINPR